MKKGLLLLFFSLLWMKSIHAELRHFSNRIYTPFGGTAVTIGNPEATVSTTVDPLTGDFVDVMVKNRITFGIDQFYQEYFGSYMTVTIEADVKRWDAAMDTLSDTTITLNLIYNPFTSGDYIDMQSANFGGAYKIELTITDIIVNSTPVTVLPANLFVDVEIFVERYTNFADAEENIDFLAGEDLDLNCDETTDTRKIIWEVIPGVEEYQLEWAYINDYDYVPDDDTQTPEDHVLPESSLAYNFKFNSTRISTTATSYELPLIFDRGYLVFRVRGVGVNTADISQLIFGQWNLAESGLISAADDDNVYYVDATVAHNRVMNWQYSVTYAEEAKKKEIISYYDGSLRGRQTVTKVNTDKNTIVGETIYDHQGRPAVNVLPVPVSNPVCETFNKQNVMQFYPNFNLNLAGDAYSREDFDKNPLVELCAVDPGPMKTTSGASNYYSASNPNQDEQQAYVPDAYQFPFSQVEYTPDNTGRIRRQGGVGELFQLNQHETKYFYGQPNQLEMDRLFGSEVGDASHYKKNVVVDANGQASISYLDQEGRVIMTNLAGDNPENLLPLESEGASPVELTVNAFGNNDAMNRLSVDGESLVFSSQILVGYTSDYTFDYTFTVNPIEDPCLDDICIDCVYDLTLELIDECGVNLWEDVDHILVGKFVENEGTYTFHGECGEETEGTTTQHLEVENLEVGSYTLNKRLTINNEAREAFIDLYFNDELNACVQTYEDFLEEELENINTEDCEINCENCLENLGSLEDYIANGEGTEQDYYLRRSDCELLCNEGKTLCEITYDAMLVDMSPGGQYCEFNNPANNSYNPALFALSILNESSMLPQRFAEGASWRKPLLIDDLGEHLEYRDENGQRSRIFVFPDENGNWSPAIVNNNPIYVFTDELTGENFTYPEYLANGVDFKNLFKPSWAKSLVAYHPEYCYYETCHSYSKKINSEDNFTAQDFETLLKNTNSWQEAIDNKLIVSGTIDWFAPSVDPEKPYDVFVYRNSAYNVQSEFCEDYGTALEARFDEYQEVSATPRSMLEMAAYLTLSALQSEDNTITVDFDFWGFAATATTEEKNLLWQNFKALYLGERGIQLSKRADCLALKSCSAFNNCIGEMDFRPWTEGMLTPFSFSLPFLTNPYHGLPYFSLIQPCGAYTKNLYKYKIARFLNDKSELGTPENIAYQNYIETGKCPVNYSFQSLLNYLAQTNQLDDDDVHLNTLSAFSNLLTAENNFVPLGSVPDVVYNMGIAGMNPHELEGTWNDGMTTYATFKLEKQEFPNPEFPLLEVDWDDIEQIVCLECVNEEGDFEAKGIYYIEGDENMHTIDLTGRIDRFDLCNEYCEFNPVCEANELSEDLSTVMTVLQQIGELDGTEYNLSTINPTDDLNPGEGGNLDFRTIRGAVGAFDAEEGILWSQTVYGFKIESESDNEELQIHYESFDPGTFSLADFDDILYFEPFMPENETEFSQVAWLPGDVSVILHGKLLKVETIADPYGSKTFTIEVGNCDMLPKASCNGPEHQNYRQMQRFIKELLLNHDYTSEDFAVSNMVEFTGGLEASFPYDFSPTTSYYFDENTVTQQYYNYLYVFGDLDHDGGLNPNMECKISFYNNGRSLPVSLPFSALTDVSDFFLYHSNDPLDTRQTVTCTGTFTVGDETYLNKIYISSNCLNMKTCSGFSDNFEISSSGDNITIGLSPTAENDAPADPIVPTFSADPCPQEGEEPDPESPELVCKPNYFEYLNCKAEFNLWAEQNEYPYRIQTTVAYDLFVSDYCECYEEFCTLLDDIKTETAPEYETEEAFRHFTDLKTICGGVGGGGGPGESNPCFIPDPLPLVTLGNDCIELQENQAALTARIRYELYVNNLKKQLYDTYNAHCLAVDEEFGYTYDDKMYHYMLYYYDQAGNLVRTVPPAGVELLATTSSSDAISTQIAADRTNGTKTVYTDHRLVTRYEYNSLNQLIGQSTPDTDPMEIFDIAIPKGLLPTFHTKKIQMVTETRGYLGGWTSASTIRPERGWLYQTDDGGETWRRVNNLAAVDIRKVKMISGTNGYAAGSAGIILKTTDRGSSWDMIYTWNVAGTGMIQDINDFHFVSTGTNTFKGVFIGENGLVAVSSTVNSTTTNTETFTLIQNGIPSGASLVSISANTTDFYMVGNNVVNGVTEAAIYKKSITSSDATAWTEEPNFNAANLLDVQFVENDIAYAVGNDGRLYRNIEGANTGGTVPFWVLRPTNVSYPIKAIAFFDEDQGAALMETATGVNSLFRTVDAGVTWTQVSTGDFNALHKSADNSLIIAGGENAALEIMVPQEEPYENIQVAFIDQTTDFTSVWVEKSTSGGISSARVIAGDANEHIYATANAFREIPLWVSTDVSATITGNVVDIEGKTFPNGNAVGVMRTSSNRLYTFECSATQAIAGIITTTGVSGSDTYATLAMDDTYAYTYNNTNYKVGAFTLNNTAAGVSYAELTTTLTGSPQLDALAAYNRKLIGVNSSALIHAVNLDATASTVSSQAVRTNYCRPGEMRDFELLSGSYVLGGVDGALFKRSTASGTPWVNAVSGINENINAVKTANSEIYVAGENALLRKGTIASNAYSSTEVALTNGSGVSSLGDVTFFDMENKSHRVYVVGEAGTILYTANVSTTPAFLKTTQGNRDLHSVCYKTDNNQAYIAGDYCTIHEETEVSYAVKRDIFIFAMSDIHFKDPQHGTILAKNMLLRVTHDGGATWEVIKPQTAANPTSFTVNKVWTYSADLSLLFGTNLVAIHEGRFTLITNASITGIGSFNQLTAVSQGLGNDYLHVGVAGNATTRRIGRLNVIGTSYPYTYSGSSLTNNMTNVCRNIHVFDNNEFIITGDDGLFHYYEPGNLTARFTETFTGDPDFRDMDFYDHVHGVIVADNGAYYRIDDYTVNSSGYLTDVTFGLEARVYTDDPDMGGVSAFQHFSTVAYVDKNHLMLGGRYISQPLNPNYSYVRKIYDPIMKYSSRFYYDRLGRLVVSQNGRQYNLGIGEGDPKFSYTRYDALGRIIEAGEKTENDTDLKFKEVFGTNVSDYYNPQTMDDDRLAEWIEGDGERREVTRSYYDETVITGLPLSFVVNPYTQRKRITHVTYEELFDDDDQTYDHATHYSYDIHGNVKTLLQDNRKMAETFATLADHQFKRMDYSYDLISGNVKRVSVQDGERDQWHHAYEYDADNRITKVYTNKEQPVLSLDSPSSLRDELISNQDWESDARYFYYAHGPLSRVELGENQLQGMDYVYNLQGWLKGVNSVSLDEQRDPGQDGVGLSVNYPFVQDVMGFALTYNAWDYTPISSSKTGTNAFQADMTGSDVYDNSFNLFNGNIRSMQTAISDPADWSKLPMANAYKYDQLNRLIESRSFTNIDLVNNEWDNAGTYDNRYFNQFSYDAMGNILTQVRHIEDGTKIEDLTYRYHKSAGGDLLRNRLYHVDDAVADGVDATDIDDQDSDDAANSYAFVDEDDEVNSLYINGSNNYVYDAEGRLVEDKKEGIANIVWRVDGKVKEITRTTSGLKRIKFDYDAMGNRIAKHIHDHTSGLLEKSTYYVLDATGNTMNIYEHETPAMGDATYTLTEKQIYGASRLGMETTHDNLLESADPSAIITHYLGFKQYEMKNHLNNVLTVINDKTMPLDGNTDGEVDGRRVYLLSASDYSPFGVQLDGREFSAEDYRYGFQGQERDDEVKGEGNSVNYTFRMHDSRIGRFFAVDPLADKYPHNSPYAFSENSTIAFVELEGLEKYYAADGTYLGSIGNSTEIRVVLANDVKEATKFIGWANYSIKIKGKNIETNTQKANSVSISLVDYATTTPNVIEGDEFESYGDNGLNCYTAALAQMENAGIVPEGKSTAIQTSVDNSIQPANKQLTENTIGGTIYAITQLKENKPVMVGVQETDSDGNTVNVGNDNRNTGHFVVLNKIIKVGNTISIQYTDNASPSCGQSSGNQFSVNLKTGEMVDDTNPCVGGVETNKVSEVRKNPQ